MTLPFGFDFEFECFSKATAVEGRERRIGGIVSTDHLDRQQEVLLQDGLDFSPFLKSGWFNDNHDNSTDSVIGYPETAELRSLPDGRKGWYVEGYLLKGSERADRIWDLANALQKTDRRLGFSVEGSIVERDPSNPSHVKKAIVREVAITKCPVNTNTSLGVLAKSLSAGSAVTNPGTAPGEGFPLRTESLEGEGKKKKKRKLYSKSEAAALLKAANSKVSDELAEKIVNYAARWHAAQGETNE